MESLSVQCKLRILEQNTVTRTTTNMWTPLALLALVAPALAVPCGKNFTITSANKGDACLGATYDSGFATVTKCNGSPGQTWMWDGLKIYNYVGPANNRACLTFSPCESIPAQRS